MMSNSNVVTDQNIIAQLEGNNSAPIAAQSQNGSVVTDPNLIAQLEGQSGSSQNNLPWYSPKNLTLNNFANNPLTNALVGGSDALNNAMANLVNLVPGGNISPFHGADGAAYTVGNIAGSVLPFEGAFRGAGLLAEGLPYASNALSSIGDSALGQALSRMVGSSAYGAVNDPNNRMAGAELGGGLGAIGETPGLIGQGLYKISPNGIADQISQNLGNGATTLQDNAKALADALRNSYQKQFENGQALYKPVFDAVGNSKIYNGASGLAQSNYGSIPSITNDFAGKLGEVSDNFNQNPTFQNAHDLQSQLGSEIRKLQNTYSKSGLSVADGNTLYGYQKAQQALLNDMGSFLDKSAPGLSDQYDNASANWLQNVVPYTDNAKISQIAKGGITNPKNIATIFKSPEPDIEKVVSDIGPEANQRIIYNQLLSRGATTPDAMASNFNKLDQQGLGSYVTPDISSSFSTLQNKLDNNAALQHSIGMFGGAIASKLFPGEFLGKELIGGTAGNLLTNTAINNPVTKYLGKAIPKYYPTAKSAAIAYNLQGNQ